MCKELKLCFASQETDTDATFPKSSRSRAAVASPGRLFKNRLRLPDRLPAGAETNPECLIRSPVSSQRQKVQEGKQLVGSGKQCYGSLGSKGAVAPKCSVASQMPHVRSSRMNQRAFEMTQEIQAEGDAIKACLQADAGRNGTSELHAHRTRNSWPGHDEVVKVQSVAGSANKWGMTVHHRAVVVGHHGYPPRTQASARQRAAAMCAPQSALAGRWPGSTGTKSQATAAHAPPPSEPKAARTKKSSAATDILLQARRGSVGEFERNVCFVQRNKGSIDGPKCVCPGETNVRPSQ